MANTKISVMDLFENPNPNRPDEKAVRMELIEQLKREGYELKDENAELRCASRLLNARLVDLAARVNDEQRQNEDLRNLVRRARDVLKIAHLRVFKSHKKNFAPLTVANSVCPVCQVIIETERSSA